MKRLRRLALGALLGLSACGLTGQKPSEVMKEFEALCVHNTQGKELCVTDTPGGKDALAEKMGLEWKAFDGNFQADHHGVRLTYVPGFLGMAELLATDRSLSEGEINTLYRAITQGVLQGQDPQAILDAKN
ncbi:hypothetical protein [Deinococcus sp. QL22]|uniref:hypothetical protein n=1 Tax=Deinococcus sp. QL22 TaxID=2939437 RepID=UPI002017898E|nr:hypothetical protein [Deinococcus sp. QL22]UQN06537.1 hypothetical protein M1R55_01045 [Deinococcus sp. QL22]